VLNDIIIESKCSYGSPKYTWTNKGAQDNIKMAINGIKVNVLTITFQQSKTIPNLAYTNVTMPRNNLEE
jgi:hypothetical protein